MQSNTSSSPVAASPPVGEPGWSAGTHSGAAILDTIEQSLARLRSLDLDAETDDALAGSVEQLARVERMVAAEQYRRIAAVDLRGAYVTRGAGSTATMLATRLDLTKGEARTRTDTANALEQLPETADRLASGTLGVGHAETAARTLRDVATLDDDPDERAAVQHELDQLVARQGTSSDRRALRQRLDTWAEQTGRSCLSDREQRAWRRRRAWITETTGPDGLHKLSGQLPATQAAKLRAALGPLMRKDTAEDPRTPEQRCADALTQLADRALDTGDLPETAAQRPHVLLITSADALHDQPGADPSMLDGHGPISSATARQICCDAEITPVVLDRDRGHLLDVGRRQRQPTPKLRAAVIARDRHCVGCGAPATRCEIHHIQWWSNQGRTDLDNLVLVCWDCHSHIHHHGWWVTRQPDGTHLVNPAGRPSPQSSPRDTSSREPHSRDRQPPAPPRQARQPA